MGASKSDDAIAVASMPSRRTFGVTVTGRRLPARFGQPELRETGHEYEEEVLARPTRGVPCRDAGEPPGSHADCATRPGTRCGDTSMHRRGTSAIPRRGGPVAGYAAGGRVQGLHGQCGFPAVKTARVCNQATPCGVLLSFLSFFPHEAER